MAAARCWLFAALSCGTLVACGMTQPAAPAALVYTATSAAAVSTGVYPNFFATLGHSQADTDTKLARAFAQLFYGDPSSQALYYADGHNSQGAKAYILDVNNNDVRSEGMSYGMMIALQLNKKAEFDALWNWAYSHMYQADPTHPAYGYFAWSVSPKGVANDEMPAPDGEEYFATALYFASTRWGDGSGIYQYKAKADELLTQMRHRQIIRRTTSRGEQAATALFHPDHAMVRFTPDLAHADHTDASYHLPAFYEVWARLGPSADRDFWRKAASASRAYFSKAAHPNTGLTPEYGNFDGTPWAAPWRPDSVDFRFDAWRSAMNWSVDWHWWRQNPDAVLLSTRLQNFFFREGLGSYASQYSLAGKKLDSGNTAGLVAMNAVASLASKHPASNQFIQALWQHPIPTGRYRYYDGMLYLLGLLHVSGEFKAWLPAATVVAPLSVQQH
jgi:oligosaccharide reducing-end xylanase